MRNLLFSLCLFASSVVPPVFADPMSDAKYIVEHHMDWEEVRRGFEELETRMLDKLDEGFENFDAKIANRDLFVETLFGTYWEEQQSQMRANATASYLNILSPTELAWIAVYHGRPVEMNEFPKFWELDSDEMMAKLPGLEKFMSDATGQALSDLPQYLGIQRMAGLMERPDIIAFADEKKRTNVIAAIRSMR